MWKSSPGVPDRSGAGAASWTAQLTFPECLGWGAVALQNNGLVMGPWQDPHLCECLHCAEGKLLVPLALVVALIHGQQWH